MNKRELDQTHAELAYLAGVVAQDVRTVEMHTRLGAFPPADVALERRILVGRARERMERMIALADLSLSAPEIPEAR